MGQFKGGEDRLEPQYLKGFLDNALQKLDFLNGMYYIWVLLTKNLSFMNITKEEIQKYVKYYQEGKSINWIRTKYKRGADTIEGILRNEGLDIVKKKNSEYRKLPEKKILDLFNKGFDEKEIAKELSLKTQGVRTVLRRYGLYQTKFPNLTEQQKELINLSYKQGKSSREIAKFLGVSKTSVLQHLKQPKKSNSDYRKYKPNDNYFNIIDTADKAYWLGVMYGDGSVSNKENKITLNLTDLQLIKDFIKTLCPKAHIKEYDKGGNNKISYSVSIFSEQVKKDLIKHGCHAGKKDDKLNYPDIPKQLDRHFIRGLFDADGSFWFSKSARGLGLMFSITGSVDFLDQVQDKMIEHLDLNKTKLAIRKPESGKGDIRYGGTNNLKKIVNWFYKDVGELCLKRKYNMIVPTKLLESSKSQYLINN